MKRGISNSSIAIKALTTAKQNKCKLTLQEAIIIQKSNYCRFSISGGILSPEELIEYEYNKILSKNN